MRNYNYELNYGRLLQPDIVSLVSEIYEYKGEQTLFIEAKTDTLARLVERDLYKFIGVEAEHLKIWIII